SLAFSPGLVECFLRTPRRWPFIVHAAEGTDRQARDEICRLDRAGVLGPQTVLVHAVAADGDVLNLISRRRTSVIWCPSSNHHTLGQTIRRECLQSGVPAALGTDSALTGEGDLIDEIRIARKLRRLDP